MQTPAASALDPRDGRTVACSSKIFPGTSLPPPSCFWCTCSASIRVVVIPKSPSFRGSISTMLPQVLIEAGRFSTAYTLLEGEALHVTAHSTYEADMALTQQQVFPLPPLFFHRSASTVDHGKRRKNGGLAPQGSQSACKPWFCSEAACTLHADNQNGAGVGCARTPPPPPLLASPLLSAPLLAVKPKMLQQQLLLLLLQHSPSPLSLPPLLLLLLSSFARCSLFFARACTLAEGAQIITHKTIKKG